MNLGERDPKTETDKLGHSALERAAINWMMECDWVGKLLINVFEMYIFYFQKC